MIIISHRGNILGPNKDRENNPDFILKVDELGFNVEIDVWLINGKWFLGHDEPKYEIPMQFLQNKHWWCHAKNHEALNAMIKNDKINCFWHQEDDYVITSRGYIWIYPGKEPLSNGIYCMPERASSINWKLCAGICTDYPLTYKHLTDK